MGIDITYTLEEDKFTMRTCLFFFMLFMFNFSTITFGQQEGLSISYKSPTGEYVSLPSSGDYPENKPHVHRIQNVSSDSRKIIHIEIFRILSTDTTFNELHFYSRHVFDSKSNEDMYFDIDDVYKGFKSNFLTMQGFAIVICEFSCERTLMVEKASDCDIHKVYHVFFYD